MTEDTVVKAVWEYASENVLAGCSLSLMGNIGVNFIMDLDPAAIASDDAYMLFTLPNGKTAKVPVSEAKEKTVNGKTCYSFRCNVSAKEMNSQIKAQIIDGERTGEEYTYTVREYAEQLIAGAAENKEYAKAVPLVKAMLNYDAYSQKHFGSEASLQMKNSTTQM
ncbi:hypothetical protein [Ruminococcus sp.]|uniref:hypothetical protein n=1 Tax=Ruminococcus sp. TaxID=41978 RepID=UPI0025E6BD95|nr:hypothetical protein [Ruminococcus sp.]MBQ8967253.1 hypothetical protein [Ruminococcus sp.]